MCAVLRFLGRSFIVQIVGVFPFLPSLTRLFRVCVILLGGGSTITRVHLFWFYTTQEGRVGFHSEKSLVFVHRVASSTDRPLNLKF